MFELSYRPPSVRAIVVGVFLTLLLCVIGWSLGSVAKLVGSLFLFLPDQLGIVRQVERAEVISFDLTHSPTIVDLPAAGRYAFYIADVDLLTITDQIMETDAAPWLAVKALDGGRTLPVTFIRRGMALYDTPFAAGRPVMSFDAPSAGRYEVSHLARPAVAAIVPDYTSGHETVLLLVYLVQITIVLGVPSLWYYLRHREQWEMTTALRAQRRIETDAFWTQQKPHEPKQ